MITLGVSSQDDVDCEFEEDYDCCEFDDFECRNKVDLEKINKSDPSVANMNQEVVWMSDPSPSSPSSSETLIIL